jgi:hypothetical protein
VCDSFKVVHDFTKVVQKSCTTFMKSCATSKDLRGNFSKRRPSWMTPLNVTCYCSNSNYMTLKPFLDLTKKCIHLKDKEGVGYRSVKKDVECDGVQG